MDVNVELGERELVQQFSEIEMGGCYLPDDIVHNILVRLPTKSLVRFKIVCKHWRNMISGLEAIIVQQLMSRVMIIYGTLDSRNLFFKLKNEGVDCCLCWETNCIWAEKACNKFVLLQCRSSTYDRMLFVYDTIGDQFRQLPEIRAIFNIQTRYVCSLLAYDASAKSCKVVVFQCEYFSSNCFIYSLNDQWGSENWRTLKLPCSQKIMKSRSSIDFDGALYWIAEDEYNDYGAFIQPMDIATEEFMRIIKVPCQPWNINCNLLKIKGSLCFINTASVDELFIWVLKDSVESLWIQQYKISLSLMVNRPVSLGSFLHDGFKPWLVVEGSSTTHILVTIDGISTPYWYGMETKELRQIAVDYNNLEACYLRTVSLVDMGPDFPSKLTGFIAEKQTKRELEEQPLRREALMHWSSDGAYTPYAPPFCPSKPGTPDATATITGKYVPKYLRRRK